MSCPALRRVLALSRPAGRRWLIYLLSGLSAGSTTLLILVVGLIGDLMLKRDGPVEPTLGHLLEGWAPSGWSAWPWWTSYDSSLLALIGVLAVLGLLEAALLLALHRTAESGSLRVMARLQSLIAQQAARRGTRADGAVPPDQAPVLLTEVCGQLRREIAARWRIAPRTIVLLPWLLAVGLAMDFFLALYTLLLCAFAYWVHRLCRERIDRQITGCQQLAEHRGGALRDRSRTQRAIAACHPEAKPGAEFEELAQRYRQPLRQAALWEATRIPLLVLLISLCAGLLALVAGLSSDASMTRVLLLALLYARGYLPARRLRQIGADSNRAETAAAAVLAFLDQPPAVGLDPAARKLEAPAQRICFEQVSMQRDAGSGLDSITLEIPAGGRFAWVADRPETLMLLTDLLLWNCDPDSGRVLVDGVDLSEYSLASIRRQWALAPRDGQLVTGTIADNLRCGRPGFTLEHLEPLAARYRILDFIQQSPHGFHTTIGPLGRATDPAVAFRIGLARTLAAGPSLIVIQEPVEPCDEDVRHQLDLAMAAATAGRTSILLASRLSTLRSADQVFVFCRGRLHKQGGHAELLKQDALYRHLNYLWFNPYTGIGNASPPDG